MADIVGLSSIQQPVSADDYLVFQPLENVKLRFSRYARHDRIEVVKNKKKETVSPASAFKIFYLNEEAMYAPLRAFFSLLGLSIKIDMSMAQAVNDFNHAVFSFDLIQHLVLDQQMATDMKRLFGENDGASIQLFVDGFAQNNFFLSNLPFAFTRKTQMYSHLWKCLITLIFKPLIVLLLEEENYFELFRFHKFTLDDFFGATFLRLRRGTASEKYTAQISLPADFNESRAVGLLVASNYSLVKKFRATEIRNDENGTSVRVVNPRRVVLYAEDVVLYALVDVRMEGALLPFYWVNIPAGYIAGHPQSRALWEVYREILDFVRKQPFVSIALFQFTEYFKNWIVLSNLLPVSETSPNLILLRKSSFIERFYPTYHAAEDYYYYLMKKREVSFLQYGVPFFFLDDEQVSVVLDYLQVDAWTWSVDMLHHCRSVADKAFYGPTFYDGWPNLHLNYGKMFVDSVAEGIAFVSAKNAQPPVESGCTQALDAMKKIQLSIDEQNNNLHLIDNVYVGTVKAEEKQLLMNTFESASHPVTDEITLPDTIKKQCFFPLKHYPIFYSYASLFEMWAQTIANYVKYNPIDVREFRIVCQHAEFIGPQFPYTKMNASASMLMNLFAYYPGYLLAYYNPGTFYTPMAASARAVSMDEVKQSPAAMVRFVLDAFLSYFKRQPHLSSSIPTTDDEQLFMTSLSANVRRASDALQVEMDALTAANAQLSQQLSVKGNKALKEKNDKKKNELKSQREHLRMLPYLLHLEKSRDPFFSAKGVFWQNVYTDVMQREVNALAFVEDAARRGQLVSPDKKPKFLTEDAIFAKLGYARVHARVEDLEILRGNAIRDLVRKYMADKNNILKQFNESISVSNRFDSVVRAVFIQWIVRVHANAYDARNAERTFHFQANEYENIFSVANFYIVHRRRASAEQQDERFNEFVLRKNLSMIFNSTQTNLTLDTSINAPFTYYNPSPYFEWLAWHFEQRRTVLPVLTLYNTEEMYKFFSSVEFQSKGKEDEEEQEDEEPDVPRKVQNDQSNVDKRLIRNVILNMYKKQDVGQIARSAFYRHIPSFQHVSIDFSSKYCLNFIAVLLSFHPGLMRDNVNEASLSREELLVRTLVVRYAASLEKALKRFGDAASIVFPVSDKKIRFKDERENLKDYQFLLQMINYNRTAPVEANEHLSAAFAIKKVKNDDSFYLSALFTANGIFIENMRKFKELVIDNFKAVYERVHAISDRTTRLVNAANTRIQFQQTLLLLMTRLMEWFNDPSANDVVKLKISRVYRILSVVSVMTAKRLRIHKRYFAKFSAVKTEQEMERVRNEVLDSAEDASAENRRRLVEMELQSADFFNAYAMLGNVAFFIDILKYVKQMYRKDVFLYFEGFFSAIRHDAAADEISHFPMPQDLYAYPAERRVRPESRSAIEEQASHHHGTIEEYNEDDEGSASDRDDKEQVLTLFEMSNRPDHLSNVENNMLDSYMYEQGRHEQDETRQEEEKDVPMEAAPFWDAYSQDLFGFPLEDDFTQQEDYFRTGAHMDPCISTDDKYRIGATLFSSQRVALRHSSSPSVFVLPYHVNWVTRMNDATKNTYYNNPNAVVLLAVPKDASVGASIRKVDRDLITYRVPQLLIY